MGSNAFFFSATGRDYNATLLRKRQKLKRMNESQNNLKHGISTCSNICVYFSIKSHKCVIMLKSIRDIPLFIQ